MNAYLRIVGNGLLARAFARGFQINVPTCVFASGVSNSRCTDRGEFEREEVLLRQVIAGLVPRERIVYFSTCSIYEEGSRELTPYVIHKLRMEELVSRWENFIIIRLPQVVGFTRNSHTLTNYFRDCILGSRLLQIQLRARRSIIDVDDVAKIAFSMLEDVHSANQLMNIANPKSILALELLETMESVLGMKAVVEYVDIGSGYYIDTHASDDFALKCGIDFSDSYIRKVIEKYYG